MQLRNGRLEVLELVASFVIKMETCDAKKLLGVFRRYYILPFKDRFRKERDQYKVSLMNESFLILSRIQHEVVLVVL